MALDVKCDGCWEELTEPGAVVFGPPDQRGRSAKLHICVGCWCRMFPLPAPQEDNDD